MYQAPAARQLGQLHARSSDLPDTFEPGRVCARPRCITIMSVYNPGPICWACGGYDVVDTRPTMDVLLDLIEENGT